MKAADIQNIQPLIVKAKPFGSLVDLYFFCVSHDSCLAWG